MAAVVASIYICMCVCSFLFFFSLCCGVDLGLSIGDFAVGGGVSVVLICGFLNKRRSFCGVLSSLMHDVVYQIHTYLCMYECVTKRKKEKKKKRDRERKKKKKLLMWKKPGSVRGP